MATFTPNFTGIQSADGTSFVLTDTSNWEDNTEGYYKPDFIRTFIIKDAYGTIIDTIILTTEDTATKSIIGNPWYEIEFTIEGTPDFTKTLKFPLTRNFEIAFLDTIKDECGCSCEDSNYNMCDVDVYAEGAKYAAATGNSVEYQANIDNAYYELNK